MRQIELELGMIKSWRVHAIDEFREQIKKEPFIGVSQRLCESQIEDVWEKAKKKIEDEELYDRCLQELFKMKEKELLKLIKHEYQQDKPFSKYEQSSGSFFKCILCTIISLWILITLSGITRIILAFIFYYDL